VNGDGTSAQQGHPSAFIVRQMHMAYGSALGLARYWPYRIGSCRSNKTIRSEIRRPYTGEAGSEAILDRRCRGLLRFD